MGLKFLNRFTIYQCMISFLVVLAVASVFFYDFGARALIPVLIAALTATILDFAISYFISKSTEFPQSAMVTGLLAGSLLAQGMAFHIYILAAAIAILSKHLIKINGKHVFNPANIGILLVVLLFGAAHTWWIASPALTLVLGVFLIWRLKRADLALGFLVTYYLLNSIIILAMGAGFNDAYSMIINGSVIWFFAMFMLIEPKTNPAGSRQRLAYGIFVAALLTVLTFMTPKYDILVALAVGNVLVPVFNKFGFGKK